MSSSSSARAPEWGQRRLYQQRGNRLRTHRCARDATRATRSTGPGTQTAAPTWKGLRLYVHRTSTPTPKRSQQQTYNTSIPFKRLQVRMRTPTPKPANADVPLICLAVLFF